MTGLQLHHCICSRFHNLCCALLSRHSIIICEWSGLLCGTWPPCLLSTPHPTLFLYPKFEYHFLLLLLALWAAISIATHPKLSNLCTRSLLHVTLYYPWFAPSIWLQLLWIPVSTLVFRLCPRPQAWPATQRDMQSRATVRLSGSRLLLRS